MLEHVPDLTLSALNEATQAWVEQDYNGKLHSEIGEAPITRFLAGPAVTRPWPSSDALRLAFTRSDTRTQRKRRQYRHRGPPLRDPQPLPASDPHRGFSVTSISSMSAPASCSPASTHRTRPRTPADRAGRSTRSRPPRSSLNHRLPPIRRSRRCWPACSTGRTQSIPRQDLAAQRLHMSARNITITTLAH
jgi:hypothetical protein